MKIFPLFLSLPLLAASCSQMQTAAPEQAAQLVTSAPACAQVITLPHATVKVSEHEALVYLNADTAYVKTKWSGVLNGETVLGGDNVYIGMNNPDTIALGCLDDLKVAEVDFRLLTK